MKVIIAEKPSVARELAGVFGAKTRKDGYIEGGEYYFTWAFGHLIQLADPEAYGYKEWKAENLPMLPVSFKLAVRQTVVKGKYKPDPGAVKQLKVIKKLFDQAAEIIVATDAGREGEVIFRYVYHYLNCKKPFRRLWISSQTDEAIKAGFKNLRPGAEYDRLFYSAQCRSEADWIIGLNATQALSIAAGNKGVLSMGRVQTPTLAMICRRAEENQSFKPETYYQVVISLAKDGQGFRATSAENYKTRDAAQSILGSVRNTAQITDVQTRPVKETPPLLHDLSSLQQEANHKAGFTADETLRLAQSLYEAKLISYPRTGSRYIGDDVFREISQLIGTLTDHPVLGRAARALAAAPLNTKSVNAGKVTDHHALLINSKTPLSLDIKQQKLYEMIASRMLEAFSPDCHKEVTHIGIDSGSAFVTGGTVITRQGWRAVLNEPDEQQEASTTLPKLERGEITTVIKKDLLEKQTKPLPLFNEASLLKAMETAGKDIENETLREAMKDTGLGTPATRAAIIETLIRREYIRREKKTLLPTTKGTAIFELVRNKQIAQPELTGLWEKRLEEIRKGASVKDFKNEIADFARLITKELLNEVKII
jgi:DNA topoisomerase-3